MGLGSTAVGPTAPRWTVLRWVAAAAVLLVALAVALWPRGDSGEPAGPAGAAPPPGLTALRDRAALAPCPGPVEGAPGGSGPLAGVTVACLGGGAPVPLGSALAGRETLLNVWSHTCQPCRDELPALQEYAAGSGAVAVLGVQEDGTPQAGLALLAALGVHLPSVADEAGALRAALAAPPVLPLSYLVSADGSVRMVDPPRVFRSAADVAAAVGRLRAAAGAGG
jgi:thiol-disulfide isomerase/thioredoxin